MWIDRDRGIDCYIVCTLVMAQIDGICMMVNNTLVCWEVEGLLF